MPCVASRFRDCRLIRQIGLAPTKAKNIRRLGEQLMVDHGGEVPANMEALEAL